MKVLMSLLVLLSISSYAFEDACMEGEVKTFYLNTNPTVKIGPNYDCSTVERVRICINGSWSEEAPACEVEDSGGCVDFWIDQLNDKNFNSTTCID